MATGLAVRLPSRNRPICFECSVPSLNLICYGQ